MREIYEKITREAESLADELKSIRRDLHRHPELGWTEMRTSSLIAGQLKKIGFDEILTGEAVCLPEGRMGVPGRDELEEAYKRAEMQGADPEYLPASAGGFTGVVGILHCGEGPVTALRFDIDALPIRETDDHEHLPAAEGFRSENEGVMHACGHDGHTAIGLGTAKVLMACREQLHGTVKLIFQPAEEGVRGAKSIVENGHLDHVDYVLGAHLGGDERIKEPALGAGDGTTLATTKMNVLFRGKATHAAVSPELGQYAILAAASAIMNLHAIPRHGQSPTRVNVGKIVAGTGRNIVCDSALLELEVRGNTNESNQYMQRYAERIVEHAALMHGCEAEITLMGAAMCNKNSSELTERVRKVCRELALPWTDLAGASSGSEDYSFMSQHVQKNGGQSCYFNNIVPCSGSFHNSCFDFDERALVNGVKAFCGITADLLK